MMFNLNEEVETSTGFRGHVIEFNHQKNLIKILWNTGNTSWVPRNLIRKVK